MSKYNKHRHDQKPPWNPNLRHQRTYLPNAYSMRHIWAPPIPELEYIFWCETCDKGFRTQAHLEYHKKMHQKCNIDGCQYVAHPAVITKHIQMQHATGLFNKICRLNNPEEVKKWRDDRKKKYPTRANIEKKQAEIKEKIMRGEKLGLNQRNRGSNNDRRVLQNKRRKRLHQSKNQALGNKNKKRGPNVPDNDIPAKKICSVLPPVEENRKLLPFKGIQDIINDENVGQDDEPQSDNDSIEDEEDNPSIENKTNSESILCGAITSLICNYGSSDEEDLKENDKNIISERLRDHLKSSEQHVDKNINSKIDEKVCDIDLSINAKNIISKNLSHDNKKDKDDIEKCNDIEDDSGPEETSVAKESTSINSEPSIPNKIKKDRQMPKSELKRNIVKLRRKLPSTLLEKLLHKEIQHERNVILQCVRYVVENKYFDKQ